MQCNTKHVLRTLCGAVALSACADHLVAPPSRSATQLSDVPNEIARRSLTKAENAEGVRADSVVRAVAAEWAVAGHPEFKQYLDTSRAWNITREELERTERALPRTKSGLRSNSASSITGSSTSLNSAQTPPDPFSTDYFPKPLIAATSTTAQIVYKGVTPQDPALAIFATTQSFVGGSKGESIMFYRVTSDDGKIQHPQTHASFIGYADNLGQCVSDILNVKLPPNCVLYGKVTGDSRVTLTRYCGVTAAAYASHRAGLILPRPTMMIGADGKLQIDPKAPITYVTIGEATPVGDAESATSTSGCAPPPAQPPPTPPSTYLCDDEFTDEVEWCTQPGAPPSNPPPSSAPPSGGNGTGTLDELFTRLGEGSQSGGTVYCMVTDHWDVDAEGRKIRYRGFTINYCWEEAW